MYYYRQLRHFRKYNRFRNCLRNAAEGGSFQKNSEGALVTPFTVSPIRFFSMGLSVFIFLYAALLVVKGSAGVKTDLRRLIIKLIFVCSILCAFSVSLFPVYYDTSRYGLKWIPSQFNFIPLLTIVQTFQVFGIQSFSISFKLGRVMNNIGISFILLFPFGFVLPQVNKLFHKVSNCALAALAVSSVIELIKYIEQSLDLLEGRAANIDNILLNVLGAIFGFLLWRFLCIKYYEENSRPNT
jgi:glycopeptide antibiotics resistance protein